MLAAPAIVHAGNLMPVRSIERFILPAFGYESFDQRPLDVAYQWVTDDLKTQLVGWSPVPADRYRDKFHISGNTIEYGGCTLMQKPKLDMKNARAREIQAAHDLVGNWKRRYSDDATNPIVQVTVPIGRPSNYNTGVTSIAPRITRGGVPFDPSKDWEA